jgi:hypothetical protein
MNDATAANQGGHHDPIANAAERPNVPELISEFKRCAPTAGSGWDRATVADNVRFNRWEGKSADGKKHGTKTKEPFPFDGASDAEIHLADDISNELVAECFESFWRAWMLPKFGQSEESQYAIKLADHFVNSVLYEELFTQVELSAQYREHYGWVALQPRWEQEVSLEYKRLTLREIERYAMAAARGAAGAGGQYEAAMGGAAPLPSQMSPMAMLPQLILDPSREAEAMSVLGSFYVDYIKEIQSQVQTFEAKELSSPTLRKAVRELREAGETEVPVPYLCKNQPSIIARKPWDEVFITSDVANLQQRRLYLRVWLDEVELRSKELTEGWSASWVQEVLKHKGKQSTWASAMTGTAGNPTTSLAEAMASNSSAGQDGGWIAQDKKSGLVEVVYAIYRALDRNGVPGVYMTVLCPHVGGTADSDKPAKDSYGWHGMIKGTRGRIPVRIGTREAVAANICSSRGVPEIAASWQRQKKSQHDGLIDWTSGAVFPPILKFASAYDTKFRFGPGVQNTVMAGKEPKFMEIPSKGVPISWEMVQMLGEEARDYFGLRTKEFPNGNPAKKQKNIGSFLLLWTGAIADLLDLAQAHMPDAEFAEITGAPEGWLDSRRSQKAVLGMKLQFDVRELNPEFVLKQMDVMNKTVLPGDVTGTIDRAQWTAVQTRTVSPLWARAVVQDQRGASQKLYQQVEADINSMFLGNEPKYVKDDPSARLKLQYATQVVNANPHFTKVLQQGEGTRFGQLMMKYVQNLQFSITQEENRKVGAIGVKPETMGSGQM